MPWASCTALVMCHKPFSAWGTVSGTWLCHFSAPTLARHGLFFPPTLWHLCQLHLVPACSLQTSQPWALCPSPHCCSNSPGPIPPLLLFSDIAMLLHHGPNPNPFHLPSCSCHICLFPCCLSCSSPAPPGDSLLL